MNPDNTPDSGWRQGVREVHWLEQLYTLVPAFDREARSTWRISVPSTSGFARNWKPCQKIKSDKGNFSKIIPLYNHIIALLSLRKLIRIPCPLMSTSYKVAFVSYFKILGTSHYTCFPVHSSFAPSDMKHSGARKVCKPWLEPGEQ